MSTINNQQVNSQNDTNQSSSNAQVHDYSQAIDFQQKPPMTDEKKQEFWRKLLNAKAPNNANEFNDVISCVDIPDFLFRFRKVDINNLDALCKNDSYFSRADYYDDPFDTLMFINIERINKVTDKEQQARIAALRHPFLSYSDCKDDMQKAYNNIISYSLDLRYKMQKTLHSICLTEHALNETLWLKYADNHRGFALIYDFRNFHKISNTTPFNLATSLDIKNQYILPFGPYPIYYYNENDPKNLFDSTNTALKVKIVYDHYEFKLKYGYTKDKVYQEAYEYIESSDFSLDKLRLSLIKKDCHYKDEEWRIVLPYNIEEHPKVTWQPYGVVLGIRMSEAQRNLVISMAKQAGVKQIYQLEMDHYNKIQPKLLEYYVSKDNYKQVK